MAAPNRRHPAWTSDSVTAIGRGRSRRKPDSGGRESLSPACGQAYVPCAMRRTCTWSPHENLPPCCSQIFLV
eukprot:scaffold13123_cov112-Isochrysis_galbana.AAC.2